VRTKLYLSLNAYWDFVTDEPVAATYLGLELGGGDWETRSDPLDLTT